MRGKKLYAIVILIFLAIVFLVVSRKMAKKPEVAQDIAVSVRTAAAYIGDMTSVVEVSGDIKALNTVTLSAKAPGRIVSVPYREGDSVRAGAAVVTQDTSDLRAQVRQAQAGLQAAKARLSQALTSAGLTDTQTEAQVAQAKAALDAARANLQIVKKGARSQQVAQAESAVISAKASYENAKANRDRMKDLFDQGAISPQQWDAARMQYEVAAAQYESAKQQLSLVKEGARQEEIRAAEKQVAQAEEALRIAKANRGQKSLRQEDIKSARAGVAQAEANLAYARQQLENAYIRTPISGTVAHRYAEPGQMATPGVPLMEIVALDSIYFEANVSEIDIDRIKVGQPVSVTVDALPGRKFVGSVQKLLPTANPKSRQFAVRIAVQNKSGELRPGMFARGSIEVARHANTVIVPKDALIQSGDNHAVYAVVDSVARFRPVRVGFQTRDKAEIISGVRAGDDLVVVGQDRLSDGVKVHVAN